MIDNTKTDKSWTDVSIIIPTYSPGEYLFECLSALNNQTLKPQCFKVILVLNGERDPYFDRLKKFIKDDTLKYDIVLMYTSQKGVSNARNIGIEKAFNNSMFISFLDDDDLISKSYLEDLYNKLNGAKKTIAVSNLKVFEDSSSSLSDDYISDAYKLMKNYSGPFNNFKYRKFLSSACAKLIPVDVIGESRFNPTLSNGEDALFMFSISKNIRNIILSDPDSFYLRRVRETSASRVKRGFKERVSLTFKIQYLYLNTYFKEVRNYSFILLLSRLLATAKTFLISK